MPKQTGVVVPVLQGAEWRYGNTFTDEHTTLGHSFPSPSSFSVLQDALVFLPVLGAWLYTVQFSSPCQWCCNDGSMVRLKRG